MARAATGTRPGRGKVLLAAALVSAALGSIHAFSVFLAPLETAFGAERASVSLTYSFALLALTTAVLTGPRVFAHWSAARFMGGVCVVAALGAIWAGLAGSLPSVWLGYSLIFGAANGLGYGFGLQIAAQAYPGREGFAMGVVTAAYALGAVVSPVPFEAAGGFQTAMFGLAGTLVVVGAAAAMLLGAAKARFKAPMAGSGRVTAPLRDLAILWFGYFGGVLAGLMLIGHAAGIAAVSAPDKPTWAAPMTAALCNLAGSLICGRLADRAYGGVILIALALTSAAAATVFQWLGPLVGIGVIGFCYGGAIAVFPAVIAKRYGTSDSPRIYGKIFTAWGAAGLAGPWLAGRLYDGAGNYDAALIVAATASALGASAFAAIFWRWRQKVG